MNGASSRVDARRTASQATMAANRAEDSSHTAGAKAPDCSGGTAELNANMAPSHSPGNSRRPVMMRSHRGVGAFVCACGVAVIEGHLCGWLPWLATGGG